jgi:tetratricopeptide (TPR) repeat protein
MTESAEIDQLKQFLSHDPENALLVGQLARAYLASSQLPAAREVLDSALQQMPEAAELYPLNAQLLLGERDAIGAVEWYRKAINAGQDDAVTRYGLAYALATLGQYPDAWNALQPVIDDRQAPFSTNLLALRLLHHLGQLDVAAQRGRDHLRANPRDSTVAGALALVLLDADGPDEARQWAQQAVDLDPANEDGRVTLATLAMNTGDVETARGLLEGANGPERRGRALIGLGLLDLLDGRLDLAEERLARGQAQMGPHAGSQVALGWAQVLNQRLDAAAQTFASVAERDRGFSEGHGGLAVVYAMRGETAEARRLAAIATGLDPGSLGGRFAQAIILAASNKDASAQKIMSALAKSAIGAQGETLQQLLAQHAARNAPPPRDRH